MANHSKPMVILEFRAQLANQNHSNSVIHSLGEFPILSLVTLLAGSFKTPGHIHESTLDLSLDASTRCTFLRWQVMQTIVFQHTPNSLRLPYGDALSCTARECNFFHTGKSSDRAPCQLLHEPALKFDQSANQQVLPSASPSVAFSQLKASAEVHHCQFSQDDFSYQRLQWHVIQTTTYAVASSPPRLVCVQSTLLQCQTMQYHH